MPEIRAFRGLCYNAKNVDLAAVVAPPYDVISSEYRDRLYDRSPYNIVRLILGRSEDRYREAAENLSRWRAESILCRDDKPAVYVLSQTFRGPENRQVTRIGFIAACKVREFGDGGVLPHEKTLSKPKEDRFRLMKATNTNFSQIFSLFSDPSGRIDRLLEDLTRDSPDIEVEFEEVRNRVWKTEDEGRIDELRRFMEGNTVLIADGHHRYETALAYRDLRRMSGTRNTGEEPYNYTMMFFSNMESEGLVIYPTHRLVHSLEGFDREAFMRAIGTHFIVDRADSLGNLLETVAQSRTQAFGLIEGGGYSSVALRDPRSAHDLLGDSIPPEVRELDVTLLHSYVFERLLGISAAAQEQKTNLEYVKSAEEVLESVRSGRVQLGFLMNPTRIGQVRRVARAGLTMPQKSTYFFPKLVSGLVMNPLED
jgi:uncharacterized protein (DUF1015 family)